MRQASLICAVLNPDLQICRFPVTRYVPSVWRSGSMRFTSTTCNLNHSRDKTCVCDSPFLRSLGSLPGLGMTLRFYRKCVIFYLAVFEICRVPTCLQPLALNKPPFLTKVHMSCYIFCNPYLVPVPRFWETNLVMWPCLDHVWLRYTCGDAQSMFRLLRL